MKILKLLKRIGGSVAIVLFVIVAAFYISNDEIRLEPARFVKLSNGVTHYEPAGSKAAHLDLYTRCQENLYQRLGWKIIEQAEYHGGINPVMKLGLQE